MTNSNAMTNYFIVGGLLIVPFIGWLLVKEQFTGGESDASLSTESRKQLYGTYSQEGGAKRRRKTKRQRHYKNQSIRK